jgi:hypothetical protein
MALTAKSKGKGKAKAGMSDRTKKTIAVAAGSLALIAGLWWGYFNFTTIAPPDLKAPGVENRMSEVVHFLGEQRGVGRLTTDQKEQFLLSAYDVYGTKPETRAKFIHELNTMSSGERRVLNDAIFDIGHKKVVAQAQEYASLPPAQRPAFLDKALGEFTQLREKVAGQGPADSLSDPLKSVAPTNGDEMMKTIVDRTDGKERSQAKPFVDAMAAKYKEQEKKGKKG